MAKGKSALALALKKKIGSNDEIQKVTHWIDTGFPPLNRAISGRYDGGFPCVVSSKYPVLQVQGKRSLQQQR